MIAFVILKKLQTAAIKVTLKTITLDVDPDYLDEYFRLEAEKLNSDQSNVEAGSRPDKSNSIDDQGCLYYLKYFSLLVLEHIQLNFNLNKKNQ